MEAPLRLLVIEDNPADFLLLQRHLRHQGLEASCARIDSLAELESALAAQRWDAVLADYNVPGMAFGQSLDLIRSCQSDLPVILVTGALGEEKAVDLLKQGCSDFVLKGNLARLVSTIERSLREVAERRARREAEEALRESEDRYRSVITALFEGVVLLDADGAIWASNPSAQRILGLSVDQLAGRTLFDPRWQAIHEDGSPFPTETFPAWITLQTGQPCHDVIMGLHKPDGSLAWLSINSQPLYRPGDTNPYAVVASFADITERRQDEYALRRANRTLKTLSAGNQALVRAVSEDELLQEVTKVIVEKGGYLLAVVDYALDNQEKIIMPMAWFGAEENLCWAQYLTWADTEQGQLPIAKVIRSGATQICHDIASDSAFKPWRDAALSRGYVSNIALPLSGGGRTFGGLSIYASEMESFDEDEVQMLEELANDLAYGIITLRTKVEHEQHATILRQSLEQSIQTIAGTVEARDPYTAGHQRRVGELAAAIAREMGLPEEQVHGIHLAAIIHDLGKIHIPAEILAKPGKLTDLEYMLIKTHPQAGYDILKDVKFPWPIADIILQHHERLDGSGYPQGLKGEQILLEARIIGVADVVEAMSSHRPYRPALGVKAAMDEIKRGLSCMYDPLVVATCLRLLVDKGFQFSSNSAFNL